MEKGAFPPVQPQAIEEEMQPNKKLTTEKVI